MHCVSLAFRHTHSSSRHLHRGRFRSWEYKRSRLGRSVSGSINHIRGGVCYAFIATYEFHLNRNNLYEGKSGLIEVRTRLPVVPRASKTCLGDFEVYLLT